MVANDTHNYPEVLTFNGVNGASGGYLLPEISPGDLFTAAKSQSPNPEHLYDLKLRLRQAKGPLRAVKEGVDPLLLSQAGWGVIFAFEEQDRTPAIQEALTALLNLRKEAARGRYKEFICRPGETKTAFLARYGAGPGPADPDKVPYYLLIIASPGAIPYDFQYQLDVQYAVGRLYFDKLEDYAQYARSVVAMESGQASLPRQAAFFGVQNDDDQPTQLSATQLVLPLARVLAADPANSGWEIHSLAGEAATKAALSERLGGAHTPALLFTASHGMGFPKDDPRQLPHQGALLCQDWPGPSAWREAIPEAHYFSADDLASDTRLMGGVSFHFACFSAGTPHLDDFAYRLAGSPAAIASQSFIARLPQRLLSHPAGGLLAVIGHVERAWGYSFAWRSAGSQLAVFESALKRLMAGYPVGYAMEYFNARYAELSTVISSEMLGAQFGKLVNEIELVGMWTANNDARSYVILGDPAVRLRLTPLDEVSAQSPVTAAIELAPLEAIRAQYKKNLSPAQRRQALELAIQALQKSPQDSDLLALLGDLFTSSPSGNRLENLQSALSSYQAALQADRSDNSSAQAEIQHRLAEVCCELYALTGEGQAALEADEAITQALALYPAGQNQPERSALLSERAHLYALRFRLEKDASLAEKAIETLQQALEVAPRLQASFEWAAIHLEMGQLQAELFGAGGDEPRREQAISHLQATLLVFTPEIFPHHYARVQRHLTALSNDPHTL